ncbi:MAG: hypothetical protein NUK65_06585 [Firmicutes bacterium]|nr:hypothetical protein [Bacillota bacterium]
MGDFWQRIMEMLQVKTKGKGQYSTWFIIALVVIGIYFMYISAYQQGSDTTNPEENSTEVLAPVNFKSDYREQLERELAANLKTIKGVKDIRVFITLESGPENEYVNNEETTIRNTEEEDGGGGNRIIQERTLRIQTVMEQDGSGQRAVVARERTPQIAGVFVTVKGSGGMRLLERVTWAVQAALHMPANRVNVSEME